MHSLPKAIGDAGLPSKVSKDAPGGNPAAEKPGVFGQKEEIGYLNIIYEKVS
jgi:hypothetical protein